MQESSHCPRKHLCLGLKQELNANVSSFSEYTGSLAKGVC